MTQNCPSIFFLRNCTNHLIEVTYKNIHWNRYIGPRLLAKGYHKLKHGLKQIETEFKPGFHYSTGNSKFMVYCWGLTEHGALGLHHSKKGMPFKYIQRPVLHRLSEECEISHVECGIGFTLFGVKSPDQIKLYGCGINTDSQIGFHTIGKGKPLELLLAPAPINLGLEFCDTSITSLSAGRAHSVVVTDKEGVLTLGSNCYGQCGRPIIEEEKSCSSGYVHRITCLEDKPVIDALCGQDHTFFITSDKNVYSCGIGSDGQLGLGGFKNVDCPKRVRGDIECEKIIKIVGKSDTALALNDKGEVFGWGNNEYNQLDSQLSQMVFNPCKLDNLNQFGRIIDIACGGSYSLALNDEGDVFAWGYGILGTGDTRSDKPTLIPRTLFGCNEWQPNTIVTSIYCGISHCAAVNNHRILYMWGKNRSGCLGIGHVRDQFFPYKTSISAQVIKVSCGFDHTATLCKPYP